MTGPRPETEHRALLTRGARGRREWERVRGPVRSVASRRPIPHLPSRVSPSFERARRGVGRSAKRKRKSERGKETARDIIAPLYPPVRRFGPHSGEQEGASARGKRGRRGKLWRDPQLFAVLAILPVRVDPISTLPSSPLGSRPLIPPRAAVHVVLRSRRCKYTRSVPSPVVGRAVACVNPLLCYSVALAVGFARIERGAARASRAAAKKESSAHANSRETLALSLHASRRAARNGVAAVRLRVIGTSARLR